MQLIKALCLALMLAVFTPMVSAAEEGETIEVSALPAAVKTGFAKEAPGGEILSAKKISGDVVTYRLTYKPSDKEHQIAWSSIDLRQLRRAT